MAKKLSFSIAVNMLTENFKKGANTVENSLRSIQTRVITFAAALGAGGLGLAGLISRFRDVARETSQVLTALKNVSSGTKGFADSMRFLNDMANKYGLYVNTLAGNFAKFTAAATQANMSMDDQKKVFEALSRASAAFSLSTEQTDGVFLALSQMMGKGKISSEELRKQMGEKLPIAMQAMAKAAGVSMARLEKLLKQGELMSADIIPKFADALNEMIPNVDTDNLESSINRLKNAFQGAVSSSGFQNKYKALIDWLTRLIQSAGKNIKNIIIGIVAAITFFVSNSFSKVVKGWWSMAGELTTGQKRLKAEMLRTERERVAAELALDKTLADAKIKLATATGKAREAIERKVMLARNKYRAAVLAADKADIAYAAASTAKKANLITRGFNTIKVGIAKLVVSLKSIWNSFAPGIIVSGLIAIGGYLKGLYDKTKKLEKATEEYNKDLAKEQINIDILFDKLKNAKEGTEEYDKAKNDILSKYGGYLKGLSDEVKKLEDVEGAYKAISKAAIQAAKDRAIEKVSAEAYDEYAEVFSENATDIYNRLTDEFGKEKGTKIYDKIIRALNDGEIFPADVREALYEAQDKGTIFADYRIDRYIKNIRSARKQLEEDLAWVKGMWGEASAVVPEPDVPEPDVKLPKREDDDDDDDDDKAKKAAKAAENRLKALRELDEADRERQLEKRKFDLEMRQSAIDLMEDSFDKQTAQTKLNYDKEKLVVEEAQNELLKKQAEYAKTLYESVHGDTKGFEAYFAKLKESDFKGKDGIDILPEGLRPEDIAERVRQMLGAARNVFDKSNADNLENEKRQWNEYYKIYGEYLLKKEAIAEEYAEKIRKAEAAGNIAEAASLKRQWQSDIASVETAAIKAEIDWRLVFGEFGNMFNSVLKPELKKAEEYMRSDDFKQADHASQKELIAAVSELRKSLGGKGSLDFKKLGQEVEIYQATLRSLQQATANELVAKKNVSKAEKAYEEALKNGTEARQAAAKVDLNEARQAAADAANLTKQQASAMNTAQQNMTDTATVLSDTMRNVTEGLSKIASGSFSSAFQGVIQTGKAVSSSFANLADKAKSVPIIGWIISIIDILKDGLSLLIGSLLDAIFNAVSGIISDIITGDLFVTIGKSIKDGIGKIFNALSFGGWNSLMDTITGSNAEEVAETTDKLTSSNKVLTQSIDALKAEIEKARGAETIKAYDEAVDKQKERIRNTAGILAAQMGYHNAHHSNDYYINKSLSKNDWARISEKVGKTVSGASDLWGLSPEDLQKVSTLTDIWDKIYNGGKYDKSGYIDQYLALVGTLDELENGLNETLTQITFDSLYDSFVDTLMDMDASAEDFADSISEYFMRAMLSNKIGELYADKLEDWYKKFADSMKDGSLSGGELDELRNEYMSYVREALQLRDELAKATGYDANSTATSQDSTKGYSVSMDQDTGGAILGRITGIHESILEVKSMMSAVSIDTAKSLIYAVAVDDELKKHTAYFSEMQQLQVKSYNLSVELQENLSILNDIKAALDDINSNTQNI